MFIFGFSLVDIFTRSATWLKVSICWFILLLVSVCRISACSFTPGTSKAVCCLVCSLIFFWWPCSENKGTATHCYVDLFGRLIEGLQSATWRFLRKSVHTESTGRITSLPQQSAVEQSFSMGVSESQSLKQMRPYSSSWTAHSYVCP